MSRVWAWLVAALGILAAALLYMTGQRNKARREVKKAKTSLAASELSREVDATARKAQEQARTRAKEVQSEDDDRPDDRRPSGNLRR